MDVEFWTQEVLWKQRRDKKGGETAAEVGGIKEQNNILLPKNSSSLS